MSTRSIRILVVLVFAGAILAVAYAAAPSLLATVAVRALSGIIEVRELEIESVGMTRIEIAVIRVHNKQTLFDAQDAVVRFNPWPFQVQSVDIERARLEVSASAPGTGGDIALIPPPFRLRIDELALHAETPWGGVSLPASIEARPGRFGGLDTRLRGTGFVVRLTNPSEERHALEILDGNGIELLSLNAETGGEFPLAFEGRFNPELVTQWLRTSPITPPGIGPELKEYSVSSDEMKVNGMLQRNMDFKAAFQGVLVLRHDQDPAERDFESIELRAGPGYTVARSGSSWSGTGPGALDVVLDPDTSFKCADPEWRRTDASLSFKAADAELAPLGLYADSIQVTSPDMNLSGMDGELDLNGLRMAGWPATLAYYDVHGSWSLREASWAAAGAGEGAALPRLDWRFEAKGSRGKVEISVRDEVAALAPGLEDYARALAPDLKILTGDLAGRYRLEWNAEGQRSRLEATAGPVDADIGEMEIRGLNVHVSNPNDDLETLQIVVSAPTLKLATGTVAEDLEADLRMSLPGIRINTLRARLFDGFVSLRPVSIDLGKDEFVLFAEIDALSLERLIALFELESTQLTGKVTGPVRFVFSKQRGIEIDKGELHNIAPGVLRFSISRDSEMAEQMNNIALRALENFQYEELKASILYRPDGEYRITARIVGNNPEVLDGHPIALNPTIEGRLPALFRAFFITGDFNQAIIKRLQEEQGLSTPGETSTFQDD